MRLSFIGQESGSAVYAAYSVAYDKFIPITVNLAGINAEVNLS